MLNNKRGYVFRIFVETRIIIKEDIKVFEAS